MKKLIVISLFFLTLTNIILKAQVISYVSPKKDIVLKDVTTVNVSTTITATENITIPFKISKIVSGQTISVTTEDNNTGTATLTSDYTYANDHKMGTMVLTQVSGTTDSKSFSVVINKAPTKSTSAIFSINIKNNARLNKSFVIIVNFNSDNDEVSTQNNADISSKKDADTSAYTFTFLNAANFDITGIGKTSYLGHVNISYLPDSKHYWGFNAGMMKINYSGDSSSKVLGFKNVTISPLDQINVGSKYYKQSTYLSTIITNTAYSLYIQPMFQLYNNNAGSRFYLHFHGELAIFNTTAVTQYSGTKQQTATYTVQDSIKKTYVFRGDAADTISDTYKRSLLTGYFGAGITYIFKKPTGTFYFQFTMGETDNFPNFQSYLGSVNPYVDPWNPFYLIRSSYTANLTDNSSFILGAEIRGLFPTYKPLYAIYIGLNLNIEALAKIFSGK